MGQITSQGGDMSSGAYGMISAGVDDMMQTNEFIINTATDWVKSAKDRKRQKTMDRAQRKFMSAQTDLVKVQAASQKDQLDRKRNIRNAMYYRQGM